MKKDSILAIGGMIACLLIVVAIESCYYDREDYLYPTNGTSAVCDSTDTKFSTFVSPLIGSKCATSGCHSTARQAGSINLEGHTAIKNYITANKTAFFGSIKYTSGYSVMPKGDAKLTDCTIRKLEIWIASGMLNN